MSPMAVQNTEVVLFVLFGMALWGMYGYLFFRLYSSIRRKGYQSPFPAALMIASYIVMLVLSFEYVLMQPEGCWSCTATSDPEYYQPELLLGHVWRDVLNLAAAATAVLGATSAVAWLIPRRARRAGRRRVLFPWKVAGFVSLAGIPLALVLGITGNAGWSTVNRLGVFSYMGYATSLYLAKRAHSKPLQRELEEDPRPPVLYLRPFDREDKAFAAPLNEECRRLGVPVRNPSAGRQPATFEEYFAKAIRENIGPFVALGDPYDYLPPAGAARAYIEDDRWQDLFRTMSLRAPAS